MSPIRDYLLEINPIRTPTTENAGNRADRWVGITAIACAIALAVLWMTGSLPS